MQLQITYNEEKNGIELFFSNELSTELSEFLKEIGFKKSLGNSKKWYADNHLAYKNFAIALEKSFQQGKSWTAIPLIPSFESSPQNIMAAKFSLVSIHFLKDEVKQQKDYVLFDSYKKIAENIASNFAIRTYGDSFQDLKVYTKNYKRRARLAFKEGNIIEVAKAASITKEAKVKIEEDLTIGETDANQITKLRATLNEVIGDLVTIEETLSAEAETILATTIIDLEETAETQDEAELQKKLSKSIDIFKDWAYDLDVFTRNSISVYMSQLTPFLDTPPTPRVKSESKKRAISRDIFSIDHELPNVLVPIAAAEPFQSGSLFVEDATFLRFMFPELYEIHSDTLEKATGVQLFQLSQMPHPNDYGIDLHRSELLQAWEKRGAEAFKEIGFPVEMDYPYVNIHTGYKNVSTLATILGIEEDRKQWWSVIEHSRPIADLSNGISIIDTLIDTQINKREAYLNPKTKKSKSDKASKEALQEIDFTVMRLKMSKKVISDYLNKIYKQQTKKVITSTNAAIETSTIKQDYIDRVIAHMHTAYIQSERLSKKKIENLKEKVGAPNLGALWEAVELSWLLWYKNLYQMNQPFELRLKAMTAFWNNVQPTYAYSDSSKELYKQYSTPCPIGAIIAAYTEMDNADLIFEPSAGNGLLLVGADPRKTHVNEIDKSRMKSLQFQGFNTITCENAAMPFDKSMTKKYDVVVTNPPFSKWKDSKFDKSRIVQKYFHKHSGLEHHIRLEHLMAGLALHTMKDNGKAAIIIMGHIYYGEDGYVGKYRPFFNWLYRNYHVDDVINLNSFKLYNKQGAVAKTMLILVNGRKGTPSGIAPRKIEKPYLDSMVESFEDLWQQVKLHIKPNIHTILEQLKIAKTS